MVLAALEHLKRSFKFIIALRVAILALWSTCYLLGSMSYTVVLTFIHTYFKWSSCLFPIWMWYSLSSSIFACFTHSFLPSSIHTCHHCVYTKVVEPCIALSVLFYFLMLETYHTIWPRSTLLIYYQVNWSLIINKDSLVTLLQQFSASNIHILSEVAACFQSVFLYLYNISLALIKC